VRGFLLLPSSSTARPAWGRAWALLAIFILLSSMLAWSAAAARPVFAAPGVADPDDTLIIGPVGDVSVDDGADIVVQARDDTPADLTIGGDTVTLSSDLDGALLVIDNTDGTYSAHLDDTTPRTHTISGTINGDPITSGDATVVFVPGDLDHFSIASVTNQTAGVGFDVEVTAYDQFDNVKTDYDGGSLSGLAASPGCSGCSPTLPATPADHGTLDWTDGVGSAMVTAYDAAASATLTVTDGDVTADSSDFAVDDTGTLAGFDLQPIGSQTAGTPFGVTVTAHDAYGNIVDYNGSAGLAGLGSSPGCAGCSPALGIADPTHGSLVWSGGTGTASVTAVDADGSATLSVSDGSISNSGTFAVGHAATLAGFDLAAITSQTAGVAFGVSATAHDAYGNLMTGFNGPAALSGLDASPGCAICNPAIAAASASHGALSWAAGTGTASVTAVDASAADTLTISAGLVSDSRTFAVGPGALGGFAVATISSPKTAGSAFTVSATAYDLFGNLKDDYAGGATVSGTLGTSPGILNGSGTAPVYGPFGAWTGGASTASVTGYRAETGRTVTVSDGTPSGTSNAFDVIHANASSIAFAVPSNDVADPFAFAPITTEVSTPIYSACAPSGGSAPCATTTTTATDPSTSVRTIVRDAFGNRVIGPTVQIKNGATVLGSDATDTNGIADFGETLSIGAVGAHTLTARVSDGPTNPQTTAPITIVNDLEACDNQACDNNASNGAANVQKAFGKITTTADFFDPGASSFSTASVTDGTNVLFSTQFVPGTQTNQAVCGNTGANKTIGQATDMVVTGSGVDTTDPSTTMVLVLPKDTLKGFGITSRGTESFNVCLGALNISGESVTGWKAKDMANKKGGLITTMPGAEGRYWGAPANCGTAGLSPSDPCIALRTKQAAAARAALGMTAAEFALLGIKDADLVIIIRKQSPWDGKGGSY
jgi:hypothetical protein